jgi:hypothetical protein
MKPLSRLEPLTNAQRAQIADWLQGYHSYEKIIALAREQFGVEIPRMTLSRYRSRLALTEYLDDSPESTAAAAEIIQYAATGQDQFTPATLHILERKAFELALTCTSVDEDMVAFKNISAILCRHRNTSVRERLATVQEQKCQLRRQELQLKAVLHGAALPDPTPAAKALEPSAAAEQPPFIDPLPESASPTVCPFPSETDSRLPHANAAA